MISTSLVSQLAIVLVLSTVSFAAADVETPFPVFDETKCEMESTGVSCLLAETSGLNPYKLPTPLPQSDAQLVIRAFNPKKMIFDVWISGSSVALKKDKLYFGCQLKEEEVIIEPDKTKYIDGIKVSLLEGQATEEKLFCRVLIEIKGNGEILPVPSRSELQEELNLMINELDVPNKKEYSILRSKLLSDVKVPICDLGSLTSGKTPKINGYRLKDIPMDNLFAESITCPEHATLVSYKEVNGKKLVQYHEAMDMTCKKDTTDSNKYKWFMNDVDGSPLTPVSPDIIKYASCKYRECEMCKEVTTFPCQTDGCTTVERKKENGCDVFKCDKSWILLNDDPKPYNGTINCTAISPNDEPRWHFGNVAVEKASCPTKVPCHLIWPLKCVNDANCTSLTDVTSQSVSCKDGTMKRVKGGEETPVNNLVCIDSQYFANGHELLPADALIKCDKGDPAGPPGPSSAQTSNIGLYAGCGVGALALLIGVGVGVWCCCVKRRRKQGGSATSNLPAPSMQTNTSKSRSKETTRSREKQNTSATPVTTATSTPQTPLAVTGLQTPHWNDESHVEPQQTIFVSPLKEAPTQDYKEKSQSSAPNRPTPGHPAQLPLPFNPSTFPAERSHPEPGRVDLSMKKRRDEEGNIIHAHILDGEDDEHQPPDSAPKKKKPKRMAKKSSKTRTTSVKRTQESSTKRTQNTQNTRDRDPMFSPTIRDHMMEEYPELLTESDFARPKEEPPKLVGGRPPNGAKPKVQYSRLNQEEDESSKDENEKKKLAQPFPTPSREKIDNDYVGLGIAMLASGSTPEQVKELAKQAEAAKSKTTDDKELVTQQSTEEDKKEKKK